MADTNLIVYDINAMKAMLTMMISMRMWMIKMMIEMTKAPGLVGTLPCAFNV